MKSTKSCHREERVEDLWQGQRGDDRKGGYISDCVGVENKS